MAISKLPESFTWAALAAVDLSDKLHYLARVDTAGKIALATAGGAVIGNLYEVAEADRSVSVQFGGIGKAITGAVVAIGDKLMSDSAGKAVPQTGTNWCVGIALNGAAANGIVSFIHASA